jgi:hypothetical protein
MRDAAMLAPGVLTGLAAEPGRGLVVAWQAHEDTPATAIHPARPPAP